MTDCEHLLPFHRHPFLAELRFAAGGANHSRIWPGHRVSDRVMPIWCILTLREARSLVDLDGHGRLRLGPGDVLALPPGVRHTIKVVEGPGTSTWVHGRWTTVAGDDLLALAGQKPVVRGAVAQPAIAAIDDLVRGLCAEGGSPVALAAVQAAAWRLAGALLDRPGAALSPLAALLPDRRLAPILGFMRCHLRDRITCAGLARQAGLRVSRFHELFRAEFHQSPAAWLRRERVAEAQRLLLATDLPVCEVAARTGPWDLTSFSRTFASLIGEPPATWRRRNLDPMAG